MILAYGLFKKYIFAAQNTYMLLNSFFIINPAVVMAPYRFGGMVIFLVAKNS